MCKRHSATLFPYTTLFRSVHALARTPGAALQAARGAGAVPGIAPDRLAGQTQRLARALHERSEEHTSELQSPCNVVCRLLLETKKVHIRSECVLVSGVTCA